MKCLGSCTNKMRYDFEVLKNGKQREHSGYLGLWDKKAENGGDKSEQDVKALGAQIIDNSECGVADLQYPEKPNIIALKSITWPTRLEPLQNISGTPLAH